MNHLLERHSGERVWLVDASIYVFRAWFKRQPPILDQTGQPVHAVHGFLNFLYPLLSEQHANPIAFAFDTSLQSSIRKSLYPAYKVNRNPAPEQLKYQFQLCRAFLDALGLVQYSSLHHEADDVLGTWAVQQRRADRQVVIVSGDKDLAQLLQGSDVWWDFGRRQPLDAGGIKSTFGVWPGQLADQLALAGDKADNIPGVPGVGMATAAKLLRRFHSLEQLLAEIPKIEQMQVLGAKRLQALIQTHQDTVRLARQLTGIYCTVPELPQDLQRAPKDQAQLQSLAERLQLSPEQLARWQQV